METRIQVTIKNLKQIITDAEIMREGDDSLSDTIEIFCLKECETHTGSDLLSANVLSSYAECDSKSIRVVSGKMAEAEVIEVEGTTYRLAPLTREASHCCDGCEFRNEFDPKKCPMSTTKRFGVVIPRCQADLNNGVNMVLKLVEKTIRVPEPGEAVRYNGKRYEVKSVSLGGKCVLAKLDVPFKGRLVHAVDINELEYLS